MSSAKTTPRRIPWTALGVVTVVVVVLYGRALIESKGAYESGIALIGEDERRANEALRHAVEWYAPGNGYSAEAVAVLLERGRDAAPHRDRAGEALDALESLRTGVMVTRSLWTPYRDEVDEAESLIATLRAREVVDRSVGDEAAFSAELERQLALLVQSRDRAPHPWWSLLTGLAFVAWIATTWRAIHGRGGDGDPAARQRRYALASVISLGLWILGLACV